MTGPERVAAYLAREGVRHLFGVPGGGRSSDVVLAAEARGIKFVLAQAETAAALMGSAQGEITGRPGVCITTLGPGVTSVANGLAHASLDRAPLLLLADAPPVLGAHQRLQQAALLSTITKAQVIVHDEQVEETIAAALATAMSSQPGPVYVELSFSPAPVSDHAAGQRDVVSSPDRGAGRPPFDGELALVRSARRPVALIGLEIRAAEDVAAVRSFCEVSDVPALVTYKAKGVIPDDSPSFAGVLTNAAIERPILDQADLIIAIGLDPVELLPRRWTFAAPVIGVGSVRHSDDHVSRVGHVGSSLADGLARVASTFVTTDGVAWARAELARARALLQPGDETRLAPLSALAALISRWGDGPRVTVDAGAHMLPAMFGWPAHARSDILISNGLSTMGYALPAAIGAAILDPSRPVVALTGDGGLLMCLGELATLARENLDIRVVVFDDRSLSLIRLKQEQRGTPAGVDLGPVDWAGIASSFGIRAWCAATVSELRSVLAEADGQRGPSLVALRIETSDYTDVLTAIRG